MKKWQPVATHESSSKPAASDPLLFDSFKPLAAKLVQVPSKEVDEREAEYQLQQAKKPKRGLQKSA